METYVTNAAWLRTVGRIDLIDDVADAFERPTPAAVWPARSERGWVRGIARWPSPGRLARSA